jgi:hypothetical protein
MGGIFYLMGIVLAGYSGYSNLPWYLIFVSSALMTIGYFIVRGPQIRGIVSVDGAVAIPKLFAIQIVLFSIITAPIYFIAYYLINWINIKSD